MEDWVNRGRILAQLKPDQNRSAKQAVVAVSAGQFENALQGGNRILDGAGHALCLTQGKQQFGVLPRVSAARVEHIERALIVLGCACVSVAGTGPLRGFSSVVDRVTWVRVRQRFEEVASRLDDCIGVLRQLVSEGSC